MKFEFDTATITGLVKKFGSKQAIEEMTSIVRNTLTDAIDDVKEFSADKIDDAKEIAVGAYEGAKDRINKKD